LFLLFSFYFCSSPLPLPPFPLRSPLQLPTYVLADRAQCNEFFSKEAIDTHHEDGSPKVWVEKASHIAWGQGITFHEDLNALREKHFPCVPGGRPGLAPRHPFRHKAPQWLGGPILHGHIVQQYIRNQLFLNGHKCEMRVYWVMVGAANGKGRFFLHEEGLMRLAANKWNTNLTDVSGWKRGEGGSVAPPVLHLYRFYCSHLPFVP
jgi:hypothetical protein